MRDRARVEARDGRLDRACGSPRKRRMRERDEKLSNSSHAHTVHPDYADYAVLSPLPPLVLGAVLHRQFGPLSPSLPTL